MAPRNGGVLATDVLVSPNVRTWTSRNEFLCKYRSKWYTIYFRYCVDDGIFQDRCSVGHNFRITKICISIFFYWNLSLFKIQGIFARTFNVEILNSFVTNNIHLVLIVRWRKRRVEMIQERGDWHKKTKAYGCLMA